MPAIMPLCAAKAQPPLIFLQKIASCSARAKSFLSECVSALTAAPVKRRRLPLSIPKKNKKMERLFERTFYATRWFLAPVFLGLSLSLVALAIKFFQELAHVLPHVLTLSEADLILSLLSLIDMGLVGGLIVMVMYSSYENFVSRMNLDDQKDEKLGWLGKMDSGSLKNKVAASIVAISSIHLLRIFMDVQAISNDKLMWYVIIHLTFVLSAFVMCCIDIITKKSH